MTQRLGLTVRDAGHGRAGDRLELIILVDSEDLLSDVWDGMGRDPDALLGPDSPLFPADPARHVIVQRCGCGIEGCGSLEARIRRAGDEVIWDDFEVCAADSSVRRPIAVGEWRFDAGQYEAELRRAHQDRSWESDLRLIARLITEPLAAGRPLSAPEWTFEWASAGPGVPGLGEPAACVRVSLGSGGRQIILSYPVTAAQPEVQAANIVDDLLAGAPDDWPTSFKGGVLAEWSNGELDLPRPGQPPELED